jgi:hypothetical protein
MKFFKILLISGLLFPFSGQVFAEKLRVLDKGFDGNNRYYTITCPNKKQSSVVVTFDHIDTERRDESSPAGKPAKVVKTCMYSYSGKEACKPKWNIDEAALESCK